MKLFALNTSREFGLRVAARMGVQISAHEEREFSDGEHKARPLESVRGQDVYVVQGLHSEPGQSVNDKLLRQLFFGATLRDAGARRVTAVIPYLAYSRKDRRTKSRDPITTRYVAQLLEAAGFDAVLTLDVHNVAAFQNAFRCNAWHLDTRRLFVDHLLPSLGDGVISVASPDPGGIKRAQLFREALEAAIGRPVNMAFIEKRRSAGVVTGSHLAGEVADATVVIVDDMIASGGTMLRAAKTLHDKGARSVICVAAHGNFVDDFEKILAQPEIARWIITDTIPPPRLAGGLAADRLEVVSATSLIGDAIRALADNASLVSLLANSE